MLTVTQDSAPTPTALCVGLGQTQQPPAPPSAQGDTESRAQGLGLLHPVSEMESQSQGTLPGGPSEVLRNWAPLQQLPLLSLLAFRYKDGQSFGGGGGGRKPRKEEKPSFLQQRKPDGSQESAGDGGRMNLRRKVCTSYQTYLIAAGVTDASRSSQHGIRAFKAFFACVVGNTRTCLSWGCDARGLVEWAFPTSHRNSSNCRSSVIRRDSLPS